MESVVVLDDMQLITVLLCYLYHQVIDGDAGQSAD